MFNIQQITNIEDLYKKIWKLENIEQRTLYEESIEKYLAIVTRAMNNRSSGALLTKSEYYAALVKAGNAIIADCRNYKNKGRYPGEIWAMTFWQDKELDTDGDIDENVWVKKLKEMEEEGIHTYRICVMSEKKRLLKEHTVNNEVDKFLKKFEYYGGKKPSATMTTLFVDTINNIGLQQEVEQGIYKGFFAIKLSDGKMKLIRGMSPCKPNANGLDGEIDFDSTRVTAIRTAWESLRDKLTTKQFLEYINTGASEAVKEEMKKMGFEEIK